MPKITIDGKSLECRPGIPVLLAALEAGWDVPHYCYHPGLTIVASCRLCLMEMKAPDPKTKELVWVPKLFPSCQTPVAEGMEVRFHSPKVVENQQHVMEYYLLNHPLDCPVCDKAGECYLQDYSEKFGHSTSRMVEEKYKNPKKDIGSHTLLYQDRCVLCSRCVRFCHEVAGTGELAIVDRGSRAEIDVFPGVPLENPLQGNVVDLCPVGCLLDKGFLFKQRVWLLEHARSVSIADSSGSTIWVDSNEHGVHRIRPRFNERANQWWISDECRFSWRDYVHHESRRNQPLLRRDGALQPTPWEELAREVKTRFADAGKKNSGAGLAVVLSPMLACEEAWLLARCARKAAPQCTLVLGHVPIEGRDQTFKGGFTIRAEKCPNRRGVERVIESFGGPRQSFDEFVAAAGQGQFDAAYLTGGYRKAWIDPQRAAAFKKIGTLIVHDVFGSPADDFAAAIVPGAAWVEREGSFVNCDGLLQSFERAINPLDGVKADGQFFIELNEGGLYRAKRVREQMVAAGLGEFAEPFVPRPEPEHAH